MSEYVVDASAIIALAQGEKGWERVDELREKSIVSAVNLMEAAAGLLRYKLDVERVSFFLRRAYPAAVSFDREQAELAAVLHSNTRDAGLSFGDCACIGLATLRRLPVVTADRAWRDLDLDVEVMLIR